MSRSYASMYRARVRSTTCCGSGGGASPDDRSQPLSADEQPVADDLLVVRRLGAAGLPLAGRPEPRRVGGEHLVAEHDAAVAARAELELGVGQDDAALAAISSARAYTDRVRSRSAAAASAPTSATTASYETFSSCSPSAALVAGVKIGSGSRDPS